MRVLEVLRCGDVAGPIGVIPRNGYSTVEGLGPINGYGVQILNSWIRWSGDSSPTYLMPKFSTTKEN